MNLKEMNWLDVESYLKKDDRCVIPIGSTEQHAYLSLCTDNILAEKISTDSAEPLNIPVLPVLNYGVTPLFMAYPGTISLKLETLRLVLTDILNSLVTHGFKRILIVNGHGGNMTLENYVKEWMSEQRNIKVKFHNWWRGPEVWAKVQEIDPVASHASWMENFEWTRLKNVKLPDFQKQMVNLEMLKASSPEEARKILEEGNYGGYFFKDDTIMKALWDTAVKETKGILMEWNGKT